MEHDYRLTDAQQTIVSENHKLIYKFANMKNVNAEEFYDIFAIGLCKAASIYEPSRGYKFSTLACKCMETEYNSYWRHELNLQHIPQSSVLSYNTMVSDEDSAQFLDIISNSAGNRSVNTFGVEVEEFNSRLSDTQRVVLHMLMDGEREVDIARYMGCTRQNVHRVKEQIKTAWKRYATKR